MPVEELALELEESPHRAPVWGDRVGLGIKE